jgi:acetyl esterase/lipase
MKRTKSLRPAFGVIAAAASIILVPPLAAQDLAKPIVYSVPGMDKADARLDIVYRRDGAEDMKADIYVPPGLPADARLPAVIFIHGGPLGKNPSPGAKDWGIYRSYGRLMAASGLIGVTFDHRYVSMRVKDLETSFADVEELIRFVRTHAASYHIDPERIALWAFSGGGPHLSLGLRGDRTFIRCLVSYYASLDLTSGAALIGETPEALEKYSPAGYLTKEAAYLPPVLIGRAGLDSSSINKSVELFTSRLLALNGDVNVLSHPFGRHGFDAYDDDDLTREIIAETVAFLKSRLRRPSPFDVRRARAAAELQQLIGDRKIEAARAFVRAHLSAPGDREVTDVLVTGPRLVSIGNYFLSSDQAAAVQALEWAVALEPGSANAHIGLAAAYEKTGKVHEAVAEARKALDLSDKDPGLSDDRKKTVRDAATALLVRLK